MTLEQLCRDLLERAIRDGQRLTSGGDPQRLTSGDLVGVANVLRDHNAAEVVRLRQRVEELQRWKALDKPLAAALSIAASHVREDKDGLRAEVERLRKALERRPRQLVLDEMLADANLGRSLPWDKTQELIAEITRLRAEVERLRSDTDRIMGEDL